MTLPRTFVLSALLVALAACSSAPVRNPALEEARGRQQSVQGDPQVVALASEELQRAALALRQADQAHQAGAPRAEVDHLAYLAGQRATIARETADSRAAQAVTAGAGAERDAMRLTLRTAQAEAAQRQLGLAQQNNARQRGELAQAGAAATQSDARVDALETQLRELNAKKTERGMVVTLGDVLFDNAQSRLRPSGEGNLARLAEVFRRNPQRSATIEGYTDSVGSAASNLDLSERRARAVMAALITLGASPERLRTLAHGEEDPAADNDSAAGRQMNRRVEVVFTPLAGETSMR